MPRHGPFAFLAVLGFVSAIPVSARADEIGECADAAERGQVLRDRKQIRAAHEAFARCARPSCPGVVTSACTSWLREVEAKGPSIIVEVVDAHGVDVTDAVVTLDDTHTIGASANGHVLDPGAHTVAAASAATPSRRADTRIVVREGEIHRRVRLVLPGRSSASANTSASANANASTTALAAEPRLTRDDDANANGNARAGRAGPPAASWILGGVALAGFGTFAVGALAGSAALRDLEANCARPCSDDETRSAGTTLVVGDIGLVVGIVALAASAIVWLRDTRQPTQTTR